MYTEDSRLGGHQGRSECGVISCRSAKIILTLDYYEQPFDIFVDVITFGYYLFLIRPIWKRLVMKQQIFEN
jgi:hypothetical protein